MHAKEVIEALGALAQETRLAIFRLLVQTGPEGMAAGQIADALGIAPSSLSFHLAQMTQAGLLVQRRLGRSLIYAPDFAAMNALVGYLTENCCGQASACAPLCDPAPSAPIPSTQGELRDEAPARQRRCRESG